MKPAHMKLGRRQFLGAAGAALVGTAIAGRPARAEGDTFTYGLNNWPTTLKPFEQGGLHGSAIKMMVHRRLLSYTPEGKLQPELAESWTQPEPGTYVFNLREARFHNGDPVTAKDVVWCLNEITRPNSTAFMRPEFQVVESAEAVDDRHVRIKLKVPTATFLDLLAGVNAPIVSAKSADADPHDPIGCGPFRVTARERGISITMERFAGYYIPGLPRFAAVRALVYVDESARLAALQAGDVDMIELVPWQSVNELKRDKRFHVYSEVGGYMYMQFNFRQGLFTNPKLRQAVAFACNRQAIVDTAFFGQGAVLETLPIIEGELFNPPAADRWKYDPARAKALLAEAGYPNGLSTKLVALTQPEMHLRTAQVVQQDLAKVGINAELVMADYGQRTTMGNRGQYELAVYGAGGFYNDPDGITTMIATGTPSYLRSFGFSSARIDGLLAKGRQELVPAKRRALYDELQHAAFEECPIVGLSWRTQVFGATTGVEGFRIYPGYLSTNSTATVEEMHRVKA